MPIGSGKYFEKIVAHFSLSSTVNSLLEIKHIEIFTNSDLNRGLNSMYLNSGIDKFCPNSRSSISR